MSDSETKDLVTLQNGDGFSEKVKPIVVTEPKDLFIFQCECGGSHFRHAGYLAILMPFMRADKSKNVSKDDCEVNICVKCRRSYIWVNEQMYEVTSLIDVKAWEKFEKEAHKATGPGGQC